jgi:hypothetical protein
MLSECRQFSQITNFLHGFESNLSTISIVSNHILSFIVVCVEDSKPLYRTDAIRKQNNMLAKSTNYG